jgi:purine-cytosine permease-like protein
MGANIEMAISDQKLGRVGFALSVIALAGTLMIGRSNDVVTNIGLVAMLLAMPGFVLSLTSVIKSRIRLGGWGVAISIFVLLNYATVYGWLLGLFGRE